MSVAKIFIKGASKSKNLVKLPARKGLSLITRMQQSLLKSYGSISGPISSTFKYPIKKSQAYVRNTRKPFETAKTLAENLGYSNGVIKWGLTLGATIYYILNIFIRYIIVTVLGFIYTFLGKPLNHLFESVFGAHSGGKQILASVFILFPLVPFAILFFPLWIGVIVFILLIIQGFVRFYEHNSV